MNSKAVVAAAISIGILTLAACGADVKHGTITSKEYDPAHSSVYLQPVYGQRCVTRPVTVRQSNGTYYRTTQSSCTSYVTGHIPIINHVAACYRLDLKNGGDTGSVCVDEAAWSGAKVGGQW